MLSTILVALLVYLAIAGARLGFMAGPIDYAFTDPTGRKPWHMTYFAIGALSLIALIIIPRLVSLPTP